MTLLKLFVFLFGQVHVSTKLPTRVKRFTSQNCFDMTTLAAIKHRELYYCEGFARLRGAPWLYHAWLTDGKHAYDIVWSAQYGKRGKRVEHIPPEIIAYVGIPMDIVDVVRFMKTTGYQGILGNWWRAPKLIFKTLKNSYGILQRQKVCE